MGDIDRDRIQAFVGEAGEKLTGDWLLVGGSYVALRWSPRRVTEDIDIIGMRGVPEERFALMDLAIELGFPIEAVNSAADFFVFRIAGWREMTEVVHRGSRATIHGPNISLLLLLKLARLSEQDLEDCLLAIEAGEGGAASIDLERVLSALDALPRTDDADLGARRVRLRAALARPSAE